MAAKPFRARLFSMGHDLGEIEGEIEQAIEGDAPLWRGHFDWQGSPGLLMAARDLRLNFPESEGGRIMPIKAHTQQLAPEDQPPFRFDFQSTDLAPPEPEGR
jgi:hypothetical protein